MYPLCHRGLRQLQGIPGTVDAASLHREHKRNEVAARKRVGEGCTRWHNRNLAFHSGIDHGSSRLVYRSTPAHDAPMSTQATLPNPTAQHPALETERGPGGRWLLGDLERPAQAFANIGPNWFASVMGTGIVANAAALLPVKIAGLHTAALAVWVLATAMLVVLLAASAVHWVRHA